MNDVWDADIKHFIALCDKKSVKMIMVGGGAVNFHGYKRHSSDVDFWIESSAVNFEKLIIVFTEMGFHITDFPKDVKEQQQNISVKFSPTSLNLELITNFSSSILFEKAYENSTIVTIESISWHVLNYDDLIQSKLKSQRPKDLLDIQELQRIRNTEK